MSVKNQRWCYSYLVDNGFSRNAAAGIVGNLIQESGCDPHANQVGGEGMGIAQWTESDRWQGLLNFAQNQGRDPYALRVQMDYLMHEMKAYGIYSRLQNMHNLEAATTLFLNVYENPDPKYANPEARLAFARTIRDRDPNMDTHGSDNNGGGNGNGGNGNGGNGNGGNNDPTPQEYGFVTEFLDSHPDIKRLVDKADDQNWTQERFEAELKETDWYRQHTTAQQRWAVLIAEKPKEAKSEIHDQRLVVDRLADSLGVHLTNEQAQNLAERAAKNQWDETDLTPLIGHKYQMGKPNQPEEGQASVTIDQLHSIAADYGVKVDQATMQRWTRQVLSGHETTDGLVDKLREQAKNLYPSVAGLLDTQSVRDILTPYMATASDELGVSTTAMKVSDPRWTKALSGQKGPMSNDEWLATLHNDPKYGYGDTEKAQSEASSLISSLGQMFGTIGG